MRVFLSYVRQDRSAAERIKSRLQKEGIEVLDGQDLVPGTNWVSAIYQAIDSADAFVVLLSKASAESSNLRTELSAAIASQSANRGKLIIPVLLEENIEPPPFLSQYQYVDMTDDWEFGLLRLVTALGKPPPPGLQQPYGKAAREMLSAEERMLREERRAYEAHRRNRLVSARMALFTGLAAAILVVATVLLTTATGRIGQNITTTIVGILAIISAAISGYLRGRLSVHDDDRQPND